MPAHVLMVCIACAGSAVQVVYEGVLYSHMLEQQLDLAMVVLHSFAALRCIAQYVDCDHAHAVVLIKHPGECNLCVCLPSSSVLNTQKLPYCCSAYVASTAQQRCKDSATDERFEDKLESYMLQQGLRYTICGGFVHQADVGESKRDVTVMLTQQPMPSAYRCFSGLYFCFCSLKRCASRSSPPPCAKAL